METKFLSPILMVFFIQQLFEFGSGACPSASYYSPHSCGSSASSIEMCHAESGGLCTSCHFIRFDPLILKPIAGCCEFSCLSGCFLQSTQTCVACSNGCDTCTSPTTCTSCLPGFTSSGGGCTQTSTCPSNQYWNITGVCLTCTSNITGCASCDYATRCPPILNCFCCLDNYYLSGNRCFSVASQSSLCNNNKTFVIVPMTTIPATCSPTAQNQICAACSSLISNCQKCQITSGTLVCLCCVAGFSVSATGTSCVASPTSCAAGTYLSSTSTIAGCTQTTNLVCLPCADTLCTSCTTSTNCFCCSGGNYLYSNQCLASCPAGTVQSVPATAACPTQISCNCCPTGQYYDPSTSTCVVTCPAGRYGTTDATFVCTNKNTCLPCADALCTSCTTSTNCNCCSGTNYLYNNQCLAGCPAGTVQTVPAAAPCLAQVKCNCCSAGQYLDTSTGTCVASCPGGTYATTDATFVCANKNVCLLCTSQDANCALCSKPAAWQCDCCSATYFLISGACSATTLTCPSTQFLSSVAIAGCANPKPICSNCVTNCAVCTTSTNCQCCTTGYLYNNQCLGSCPAGTVQAVPGTVACPAQVTCNCCPAGQYYDPSTSTCVVTCPAGRYATTDATFVCTNKNTCLPCADAFCTSCTTSTNCFCCSGTKYLYNNQCLAGCPAGTVQSVPATAACPIQVSCNCCPAGQYLDTSTGTCVASCPGGTYATTDATFVCANKNVCLLCTSQDANCALCSKPAAWQCDCCSATYFLISGACSSTTLTCPLTQFLSSLAIAGCANPKPVCSNCLTNCAVCTTTTDCQCCTTGYLYNNQCYAACPTGTYADTLAALPCTNKHICSPCSNLDVDCDKCHLSGTTIVCDCCHTKYLYNGVCNAAPLTCLAGYLPSTDVNPGCFQPTKPICINCLVPSCISCSLQTNCQCCAFPLYIYQDNCLASCPSGSYPDVDITLPCGNQNFCNCCTAPLFLHLSATCEAACPTGYYGQTLVSTPSGCANTNACLSCSIISQCSECTVNNYTPAQVVTCTCCQPGFVLFGNICQAACPSANYYAANQLAGCPFCLQCSVTIPHCDICTQSSPIASLQCDCCQTGYYLYQNQCLLSQPPGTYPSVNSNVCPNPAIFISCTSAITGCTSCAYNTTFGGPVCYTCTQTNCLVCSTLDQCLSCKPDLVLQNGFCKNNFVCHYSCIDCTSAKYDACNTCASGRIRYSNICICNPQSYENEKGECIQGSKQSLQKLTVGVVSIGTAAGTIIALINRKPFLLYRMIDAAQQLSYLYYINSFYPEGTDEMYSFLNVFNFQSLFPNFLQMLGFSFGALSYDNYTLIEEKTLKQGPPTKLKLANKATLFIANAGNIVIFTCLTHIVLFGLRHLQKRINSPKLSKLLNVADQNFAVQTFYFMSGEAALFAVASSKNFHLTGTYEQMNAALMAGIVIYHFGYALYLYKKIQNIDSPNPAPLASDFSTTQEFIRPASPTDKKNLQKYWFLVSLLKKCAISVVITGVYESPLLQGTFLILTQVIYIGYLIKIQPFDRRYIRLIVLSNEITQLTVYVGLLFFINYENSQNQAQFLLNKAVAFTALAQLGLIQFGIVMNFLSEIKLFQYNLKKLIGLNQNLSLQQDALNKFKYKVVRAQEI